MDTFDRSFNHWSIAPGITAIETPGKSFGPGRVPGPGHVMAYLVEGTEKAVLWDNGYGNGNIKAFVESLTDLPIMAVNSHNHLDHNGCNALFDEVFIGEHEDGLDAPVYPVDERIPGGVDEAVKQGGPYVWRLLKDGDQIDLGGRILTIIEVPGHTKGCITALDSCTKLLLSGDAVLKRVLLNFSLSEYRKALERLDTFDFTDILPAHYDRPLGRQQVRRLIELIDRFDLRKCERAEWHGKFAMRIFRSGNSFDDPDFAAIGFMENNIPTVVGTDR